jgi:hypothetical protein
VILSFDALYIHTESIIKKLNRDYVENNAIEFKLHILTVPITVQIFGTKLGNDCLNVELDSLICSLGRGTEEKGVQLHKQ